MPQFQKKMNNQPKKTAVLFACSNAFAFALYVTLRTFFSRSAELANMSDIYVFNYKWTDTTKKLISSCGPMTLVDYDLPTHIKRTRQIMRFTPALYARFEGFNLLEKYEQVICLDSDILIQKELKSCLEEMDQNIGITYDSLPSVQNNFLHPIDGYDMSAKCFNAGFLVLKRSQLPYPPRQIADWLYGMLDKYSEAVDLGDQGLINLLFQEFKLTPHIFSELWNLPASNPTKRLKKAFIIHSTGHRKFWCYYYFHDFYRYFSDWVAQGGEPISIRKDSALWTKWVKESKYGKTAFFQLAPDVFKKPAKFILYCIKYLFKIKY